MTSQNPSQKNKKMLNLIFIGLIALTAVTVCSKSSFLYPFNDWVDVNCYMTMGKGLTRGSLPYRDLFDHKGPLFYFLAAFAATVSPTSFTGFWILESLSAFFFLLYFWKTLCLLTDRAWIGWVPAAALVIFTSGSFCYGGGTEELCLPFLAYALYVGTRIIRAQGDMDLGKMFAIGMTSGAVLWIKYSMLGFYAGWIIIPFYLAVKKKKIMPFIKGILMIILGVAAVSFPVLLWLYLQGILDDMLEVYFISNIFAYSNGGGLLIMLRHMLSGLHLTLVYLLVPFLLAGLGILYYLRKDLVTALFFFTSGLLFGIVAFSGGHGIMYYPLPISPLSVIGFAALNDFCENRDFLRLLNRKSAVAVFTSACVAGMYFLSPNTYMMKYDKEDLSQFQFKEIICQEENPTLLNYGFLDGGFYTACGIYPEFKYFCKLNLELPEMLDAQEEYIENRVPLFVVTRNRNPELDGYECIAESSYYTEGRTQYYYLYRRSN